MCKGQIRKSTSVTVKSQRVNHASEEVILKLLIFFIEDVHVWKNIYFFFTSTMLISKVFLEQFS